jgi:hypothetical protein
MSNTTAKGTVTEPPGRHAVAESLAGLAPGIAVAAIWLATLCLSLFAPDLVSGSEQDHIPIAGLSAWVWSAAATGYVLMAARGRSASDEPAVWLGFELSVAVIWAVVALAGIFTPNLVTGSDPTSVPLAALVAPVAGMVATGFVALHACTRGTSRKADDR